MEPERNMERVDLRRQEEWRGSVKGSWCPWLMKVIGGSAHLKGHKSSQVAEKLQLRLHP